MNLYDPPREIAAVFFYFRFADLRGQSRTSSFPRPASLMVIFCFSFHPYFLMIDCGILSMSALDDLVSFLVIAI